jgi:pimeloyl-ACP methyl ester carboxylesterase
MPSNGRFERSLAPGQVRIMLVNLIPPLVIPCPALLLARSRDGCKRELTLNHWCCKQILIYMTLSMQSEVTGQGRPIVLVPGGLMGWTSWGPHAKRLSESRKVIRVQLLSVQYGLERKPLPQGYSLRMESESLANTMDDLGLNEQTDIAAWSFGAATSLDYALNHPEMVRTLTLIEPPAIWVLAKKPTDKAFQNLENLRKSIKDDISEEQLEIFLHSAGIVPDGVSPRTLPPWKDWVEHRRSLLNTSAPLDHKDDSRRLSAFSRPVLLVKGTGSAIFLHQIIDALATQLPNAKVIELPGGHAPQLASIDQFMEEMRKFQA